MTAIQWYYARGQQQCGPVSSSELKRLADQGELAPDALVWREGMKEWIPARSVRGLFEGEGALPKAAPLSEAPSPPEPPSPRTSFATFEHSTAAFQRSREGGSSHLFDALLKAARASFPPPFVDSAARLFAGIGHYGLYGAMALLAAYGVTTAVQIKATWPALVGLAVVLALVYLQYAAGRFSTASERLNRVTPVKIGSSAVSDCTAILFAILGLAILIGVTIHALSAGAYASIAWAVAGFIVCEYAAIAAMNPECLNVSISSDAGAVEEFLGDLAFLNRLWLLAAPVVFGAGVVWAMIDVAVVWAWPPPPMPAAAAPGLGGLEGLISPLMSGMGDTLKGLSQDVPELRGIQGLPGRGGLQGTAASAPSFSAKLVVLSATAKLLIIGAWPLLAYCGYIVVNFLVNLFYSIVSIPGKLDRLRHDEGNGDGESQ